jgi:hypothetical protein
VTKAKFVRFIQITPDGPAIVVEVDGREAVIPADTAGEWIAELGYTVFTPIRVTIAADSKPEPDPWFEQTKNRPKIARNLMRFPEAREALERLGMPKDWPSPPSGVDD